MERVDLEVATEFLLIAATLVELKARRLLPGPRRPRSRRGAVALRGARPLLARLLECKTFQDAARHLLADDADRASSSLPRVAGPEEPFRSLAPDPLERVSLDELAEAARAGLAPKPSPEVRTDHVAPIRASVRDAIETVLALLPDVGRGAASATSSYGVGREARDHRAVPRGARAVQAGSSSTSSRSTSFGELHRAPARARRTRRRRPRRSPSEWDDEPRRRP